MKKLLYLTTWDFGDGPSTGITNKIKAQMKAFEAYGFVVDYTYIFNNAIYFHKEGQDIFLGRVGRLLKGMGEYYQSGGQTKVFFHIVGDDPVREEYERIVEQYQLQKYVVFEGVKRGKELDKIYDMCDIGIEGLAAFRKDVFISSSLKSREYAAKGIPFITASKSDVFEGKDFVLKVSGNESNIDIYNVISFYNDMYKDKEIQKVAESIRNQAQQSCDIQITMKPIVDFLLY